MSTSDIDCMLDLETLSTRPNAIILVIGAIKFSRKGPSLPLDKLNTFYKRITIDSCNKAGLIADDKTIEWWKQQDKKVRYEALDNPERICLRQALEEFSSWFGNCRYIWAQSPDFDCTILGEAYNRCNLKVPWEFWNTRDCRTIFDIGGINKSHLPSIDKHNALQDCYRQMVGVKLVLDNVSS